VQADKEKRTVRYTDIRVTKSRFPGSTPETEAKLASIIEKEAPKWDMDESLDRLTASLQVVQKEKAYTEKFNTNPPKIYVEKVPALLITIDGEPVLRKIEGTSIQMIINCPNFIVNDGKDYYLSGGSTWFKANDLKGEWSPTKSPSKEVAEFYKKYQEQAKAAAAKQGKTTSTQTKPAEPKPEAKETKPPKIIVTTEPAELISTDGEPKFAPITGTDLLYVTNTESDVVLDMKGQESYVLLSGRWYKSTNMKDPWTFVKPDDLPAEFKKIPEPSPMGEVLASVAGTQQADDALADAQVPQTAAIKRKEAKTEVKYDGEPKFKQIPETEVEMATNTASQVLRIKGKYWVCDNAVWFTGDTPNGPWTVSDKAPPEVQKIPPDSAAYNTKYVYVYDTTPEVVYVGYLPGYVGCYPYYGTVVYGTGWYYPPYVSPYAYYPRPVTFGFSFHYSPYGGWSMGFGISYGPFTFSFWGGGYGHYPGYGYHGGGGYYHGGNTINIGEINIDNGGGRGDAQPKRGEGGRGNQSQAKGTNGNIYNQGQNKGRTASTTDKSTRQTAKPSTGMANNVYTDKAGNVYKRDSNGSWSSREGNSWKSSDAGGAGGGARPSTGDVGGGAGGAGGPSSARPATGGGSSGSSRPSGGASAGTSDLNRDYNARQQGSQRQQSYQRSGGYSGGSRGGGSRGGGGRGGRR